MQYKQSEKGKAADKRGKKRYRASEAGKARLKRYKSSNTGRSEIKLHKHKNRVSNNLLALANKLLRGSRQKSPKFIRATSFKSEDDFLRCMEASAPQGMSLRDYHKNGLSIEHMVPRWVYNHENGEDLMRCWSAENTRLVVEKDNLEKGKKIVDELCNRVGASKWPLAWKGVIPSQEEKQRMYDSMKKPVVAGSRIVHSNYASDDDFGDFDDDDALLEGDLPSGFDFLDSSDDESVDGDSEYDSECSL
jgi:hypothetical protein